MFFKRKKKDLLWSQNMKDGEANVDLELFMNGGEKSKNPRRKLDTEG